MALEKIWNHYYFTLHKLIAAGPKGEIKNKQKSNQILTKKNKIDAKTASKIKKNKKT